jgi:hypothetical protein
MTHEFIRKINYISDYYTTQNTYVSKLNVPAYPVTYYNIDLKNSIYDNEKLQAGAYEKYGVGQLSGMVWRKIQMLPVYWVEQLIPEKVAEEKGLTVQDSLHGSICIPTSYNVRPYELDIIKFHQNFMFRGSDEVLVFVVKNIGFTTFGDINYYKLSIKVGTGSGTTKVENQISEHLMYLELTQKIHDLDTASVLLKIQSNHTALAESTVELKHPLGVYLQGVS